MSKISSQKDSLSVDTAIGNPLMVDKTPDIIAFRTRSRSERQNTMASMMKQVSETNAPNCNWAETQCTLTVDQEITQDQETQQYKDKGDKINATLHQRHDSQPEKGHVAGVIHQLKEDCNLQNSQHEKEYKNAPTLTQQNIPEISEEEDEVENQYDFAEGMASMKWLKVMEKLEATTRNLDTSVKTLQGEISAVRSDYTQQDTKVSQIEHVQKQESVKIQAITAKLDEHEERITMLINTVVKQDETISSLQSVINNMQAGAAKHNLVFYNILEHDKKAEKTSLKENPQWTILAFIKKELQLEQENVTIENAFRVGSGNNRPILVSFKYMKDKQIIMKNLNKLKGKINANGKAYFISEQLPEKLAEDRRQHYYKKQQNKQLPAEHQLDLQIQKNQLMIGNKRYVPPIQPVTPATWLRIPMIELGTIDKYPVIPGEKLTKESSLFTSCAAKVSTLEEVQTAYHKIRRLEPEATHVMCAYRLPGMDFINLQSFVDDGEHGSGRALLDLLIERKEFGRAVFVARYYEGVHLGALRFKLITQLADTALKACQIHLRHHDQGAVYEDTPLSIGSMFTARPNPKCVPTTNEVILGEQTADSMSESFDTVDSGDDQDFSVVKTKPRKKRSQHGQQRPIRGRGTHRKANVRGGRPPPPPTGKINTGPPRMDVNDLLGNKTRQPSIADAFGTTN